MLFHHFALIGVAALAFCQVANLVMLHNLNRRIRILENKPSCCPPVSDL